ncbi:hypothetical protein F5884DRAFT_506855 [Xylogone sp. PMI_703]|nr:hypothetical protein F5884DRAFT_506855 [Xylogone sp. PMI_703]
METLPYEVLHQIVSSLDGISLYNLLRASPAVSRLFDHDGLQLIRAIFSKDNMCDQIRESISLIAMLGSCSFEYPSIDAFITDFIHATVRHIRARRIDEPPPPALLPTDLPDSTPILTIRRILSLYVQITYLTVSCLEHYLEKFNALQPDNIVNPTARYSIHYEKILPWAQRFESFKACFEDYGPPIWEEEQRVFRAFWRVQLFYDLRSASRRSWFGWPVEDVIQLQNMKERDLFVNWNEYEAEEIQTVIEYINYARAANLLVPHDSRGSSQRLPLLRHPVERKWPTPQRPDPHPGLQCYEIDSRALGLHQWELLSNTRASPIRTVKFDSYRRLGVAFWCRKRIQASGLAPLDRSSLGRAAINLSLWLFAWRSILDPHEVEEVEQRLQKEWEERELKD